MRKNILKPLLDGEDVPDLALRTLAICARERRDDALLLRCYEHIAARATTDLDRCCSAHQLALILARLERGEEAAEWAKKALVNRVHAFAPAQLLGALRTPDTPSERAEQREAFARSTATRALRKTLMLQAGNDWLEADDSHRALACFEEVLLVAPTNRAAFIALGQLFEEEGDSQKLQELLLARLGLIEERQRRTA